MNDDRLAARGAIARQAVPANALPLVTAGRTLAENRRHIAFHDSAYGRPFQATGHLATEFVDHRQTAARGRPDSMAGVDLKAAVRGHSAHVLTGEKLAARAKGLRSRAVVGSARATSEFGSGRILRGKADVVPSQSERTD